MIGTGSSRYIANAVASVVRPQDTTNWVVLVPASAGGAYVESVFSPAKGLLHTSGAQPSDGSVNEGVRFVPPNDQLHKVQVLLPPNTALWARSTTSSGDAVFMAHYRAL